MLNLMQKESEHDPVHLLQKNIFRKFSNTSANNKVLL